MNSAKDKGAPSLILVSFGITRECDLKCPHCYSDSGEKDPNELTSEEAKTVLRDISNLGAKLVILDGGEPTLRPDLIDIIRYSTSLGLKTVIGSHAGFLTEDFARTLKAAGCQSVAISLDGATAEIHDKWRGVNGAWAGAIQGAKNCRAVGLPFQFAPLMHCGNWDQLTGIVDRARQLGAEAVEVFDFVPSGRGTEHSEYELNTEQRKRIIEEIIRMQRESELVFRVIGLPQYWVMVEKTVSEEEMLLKFVRSCCAAGTRYITILPNGDVIPCMVLQRVLGNVRENSLTEIWRESTVLKSLRNRNNLKGKCGVCKFRFTCAGARCKAYAKTGDVLAEDPSCWFAEDEVRE